MRLVTPEKWYILFWICMGLGYAVLNAAFTGLAVWVAIRWSKP